MTGFAVDSIGYSLCNFIQFGNFRISFHEYAHLSTLPYGALVVEGISPLSPPACREWRLVEAPLRFRGDGIEPLYFPTCR